MKQRVASAMLFLLLALLVAAGFWFLLSALVTADMRFGHCGPSTIDHVEAYCRVATRLLNQAYGLLFAALVLAVVLVVRHRHASAALGLNGVVYHHAVPRSGPS
ncbi:hypothetical protein GCM10010080_30410 [Thermomonas carbonis]|nr:hypothetical protein GCM10010080_30410 [Thermomonas carbonis]